MPETITLEDGSTREVPTKEELDALQQASTKVAEFETTLKTKEDEWKKKEEELNGMVNPNWKAAREKIERLEKLEAQGKTLDGEGKVVDKAPVINPDELMGKAVEAGKSAAMSALLEERKKTLLGKYDKDTKTVIEHYYNKLITGEQLNLDNMEKFMKEAEGLANPQALPNNLPPAPNGAPPRFQSADGKSFAESDQGKNIANEIWGDKSYGKSK